MRCLLARRPIPLALLQFRPKTSHRPKLAIESCGPSALFVRHRMKRVPRRPGPIRLLSMRFAVRGHWRKYEDPTRKGHDAFGEVVFGRTWVREHTKGADREAFLANTEQVAVDPNITVYVKQSVAYAKAVVRAQSISPIEIARAAPPSTPEPSPIRTSVPSKRPPSEWMANERRKLTAALRYCEGMSFDVGSVERAKLMTLVLDLRLTTRYPLWIGGSPRRRICGRCAVVAIAANPRADWVAAQGEV